MNKIFFQARKIQKAGALAGIVFDNVPGSSAVNSPMFAMSGDGKEADDVQIPFVFLFSIEANELLQAIRTNGLLTVTISKFFFLSTYFSPLFYCLNINTLLNQILNAKFFENIFNFLNL